MKIQIVSWRDPQNPKAGGAEVCLVEISKRLMSRFGHEVSWFAPEFPGGTTTGLAEGIRIERRGRFAHVHMQVLAKFARRASQDADFYLEDYHGITLGLGWFLRRPHVVFVHEVAGPIWFEMWKPPLSVVGFGLEKLSLRLLRRTHFIAVSESTKRDLVAHGVAPSRIHTISEGTDVPWADAPIARERRAASFLFLGRICKMKRVDLLLEAFAKHRRLRPGSKLVLAGTMDEPFRDEYERTTRRLGIEGVVELRGRVSQEEKTRLLAESLALVSCSMREGFGLVVVEAASQGTPSITFDVNGYRDVVEEGVNGFMVPFPDVDALASRMRDLIDMPAAAYDALCATSLASSRRYSWDRTAEDVNRIMNEIREKAGDSGRSIGASGD